MSSFSPGLAEALPTPQWLQHREGRLAFWAYPAPHPWLHVLVSHGFGEHAGWWHHVARALAAQGVSAYLFDHPHYGRSEGRRGDAASYDAFCDGLRLALEVGVTPHRADGAPLVLLGHSNGGLIALLALATLPSGRVDGLVLSSPLLALPPAARLSGRVLAGLLSLVNPGIRVPLLSRPWRLTGNRALWPTYGRDPLRVRRISARHFLALLGACRKAREEVSRLALPVLLLTGGQERVVSPGAARAWFERLEAPDKQHIVYPGQHHELFNDLAWEQVLGDVLAWSRARFLTASAVRSDAS